MRASPVKPSADPYRAELVLVTVLMTVLMIIVLSIVEAVGAEPRASGPAAYRRGVFAGSGGLLTLPGLTLTQPRPRRQPSSSRPPFVQAAIS